MIKRHEDQRDLNVSLVLDAKILVIHKSSSVFSVAYTKKAKKKKKHKNRNVYQHIFF